VPALSLFMETQLHYVIRRVADLAFMSHHRPAWTEDLEKARVFESKGDARAALPKAYNRAALEIKLVRLALDDAPGVRPRRKTGTRSRKPLGALWSVFRAFRRGGGRQP